MKYSIPNKRELTTEEIKLLTILFEKEKPEWNKLISRLKVIARCGCGNCPTIIFGDSFEAEIQKGELIIDYKGIDQNNKLVGISVFGNKNIPTELEFYSIDGGSELNYFPILNKLIPLNA